jgi:D-3-phosphoglycerate dehydrogenase
MTNSTLETSDDFRRRKRSAHKERRNNEGTKMAKPTVLLTRASFYKPGWIEDHWPTLKEKAELVLSFDESGPELLKDAARADVIFARGFPVNRKMMEASPKLRGVVASGVGVDKIDVQAATALGIAVANSPGNTITMAESTMLLVAAFAKNLFFWVNLARTNTLPNSATQGRELAGQTIGLIGFGRIGSSVAKLARAYGMKPIAYDPYVEPSDLAPMVPLDDLLAQSDFVSLHPLLTAETRHMINAGTLARMKPTAYLINTARGGLVDEKALVAALEAGQIAGAGLDVFEVEPPKKDNPLLSMPNVIGTPHGLGQASEARRRCATMAEESMLALIEGKLPELTVNREVKWRFAGEMV